MVFVYRLLYLAGLDARSIERRWIDLLVYVLHEENAVVLLLPSHPRRINYHLFGTDIAVAPLLRVVEDVAILIGTQEASIEDVDLCHLSQSVPDNLEGKSAIQKIIIRAFLDEFTSALASTIHSLSLPRIPIAYDIIADDIVHAPAYDAVKSWDVLEKVQQVFGIVIRLSPGHVIVSPNCRLRR